MSGGEGRYEIEVVVYPEGRLIKVGIDRSCVSVSDLLKALEEFGIPKDYYVVASEGRALSAEDRVRAGVRVVLLPLVTGGSASNTDQTR